MESGKQLISEFTAGRRKQGYAVPVMQVNPEGDALTNHAPGNAATVTPSDSTVFSKPSFIRAIEGGLFNVDCWVSGTNIQVYLNTGDMLPFPVKKVYSSGLGSGVILTRHW